MKQKIRKRKSLCFLLFAQFLLLSSYGNAQKQPMLAMVNNSVSQQGAFFVNGEVPLQEEKILLKSAIPQLEKKFKVSFVYELAAIKGKKITKLLLANNYSLQEVLKTFDYEINLKSKQISNSVIALYTEEELVRKNIANPLGWQQPLKENLFLASGIEQADFDFVVSGTITDATTKQPISGASVKLKGSNIGTSSNEQGNYSITTPNNSGVLEFSYVSYSSVDVPFNNQSKVNVSLSQLTISAEEVIVVGYGNRKRANLTGAVASIQTKELKQSPVADLSNSLIGRMPGLIATQRSGEPGRDASNILIRGQSTTGDNTPLYVIDGIPRTQYDFNNLNANEVESVTILKDASSSAVFGVRGANGVILVTTKRGKTGKSSFAYNFNFGLQNPTRIPEFLDSYNHAVLFNEALGNEGKQKLYSDSVLQKFKDGSDPDRYPNTDWFALLLRKNAPMKQHNLSVSGGSEKVKYLISGSFLDQDGAYKSTGFKRYNVRSNLDIEATKTTTISLDLSGRYEDKRYSGSEAGADIWSQLVRTAPTVVAVYSNGLLGPVSGSAYARANFSGSTKDRYNTLLSRMAITQKIPFVPGLAIRGVLAVDKSFSLYKKFSHGADANTIQNDGTFINLPGGAPALTERTDQSQSVTAEAHITYDQSFGNHGINVILLYTQNKYSREYFEAFRDGFSTTVIQNLFAGSATNRNNSGTSNASARQGFVGRVNYSLKNKYLLEANFRYDGSDNFAKGNRFGFFPSVSAGWVLTEEAFITQALPFLNFAKLRGSYGKLGNDRVVDANGNEQRFPFLSSYTFGRGYLIGGGAVPSVNEGQLGNPLATWETAEKTDIGLEATLLNNRLTVEFDWFSQKRSGILGYRNAAVPALIGASLPGENFAKVNNKGYELAVGWQEQLSNKFSYFIKGNITKAASKVIDIAEAENVNERIKKTGKALNQYFGLKAIGLFQNQSEIDNAPKQAGAKPGDIIYQDLDDNKIINAEDRTLIGKSNIPEFIYGISFGLSWKGLELSTLLQGTENVNQYLIQESSWAFFNGGKALKEHLNRWTPTNPNATYPRLLTDNNGNNSLTSSYWLQDASYLRLKNIELAYNLPESIVSKIHSTGIRVYINGINLLTSTKLKNFDPENNNERAWAYPQQKIVNFGVSVQF